VGVGGWGLGVGGLGPIPNPQSPIPNPQSPIINNKILLYLIIKIINNFKFKNNLFKIFNKINIY
jgi:hypothetical protein